MKTQPVILPEFYLVEMDSGSELRHAKLNGSVMLFSAKQTAMQVAKLVCTEENYTNETPTAAEFVALPCGTGLSVTAYGYSRIFFLEPVTHTFYADTP